MGEVPKFTEDGEWVSPLLTVGEYSFTYDNTELKFFGEQWAHLNHVEYMGPEGLMGIRVHQEMTDTLMEHEYPYTFRPFPTQKDMDWYVDVETNHLDSEIDHVTDN